MKRRNIKGMRITSEEDSTMDSEMVRSYAKDVAPLLFKMMADSSFMAEVSAKAGVGKRLSEERKSVNKKVRKGRFIIANIRSMSGIKSDSLVNHSEAKELGINDIETQKLLFALSILGARSLIGKEAHTA